MTSLSELLRLREVHRAVHAVGEHQHHAAALLVQQRRDADVDRVPERRRPFGLQLGAQDVQQLVVIRREVARIDLNAVREAADPGLVVRRITSTNCSAACCTSVKFARMLPLRSSSITTVIGWRSLENSVRSWRRPLSRIENASRVRSGTSRPSAPVTVAYTATVRLAALNVGDCAAPGRRSERRTDSHHADDCREEHAWTYLSSDGLAPSRLLRRLRDNPDD